MAKKKAEPTTEKKWHFAMIPIELIDNNTYNPNEMTDAMFDALAENIDDIGMVQPALVRPVKDRYEVVDGEHRVEAMRIQDYEEMPCVVINPKYVDEIKARFITMRMNNIKGKLNKEKFRNIVEEVLETGDYEFDSLAGEFGFVDESEFEALWNSARESIDDPDMKEEFDSNRDEMKSVDDIAKLIERLYAKYGSTLPAHFMFFDLGGKEAVTVQLQSAKDVKIIKEAARSVMDQGVTFDSALVRLLGSNSFMKWVDKHKADLQPITEESKAEELN
jgi:hypothetical protein